MGLPQIAVTHSSNLCVLHGLWVAWKETINRWMHNLDVFPLSPFCRLYNTKEVKLYRKLLSLSPLWRAAGNMWHRRTSNVSRLISCSLSGLFLDLSVGSMLVFQGTKTQLGKIKWNLSSCTNFAVSVKWTLWKLQLHWCVRACNL